MLDTRWHPLGWRVTPELCPFASTPTPPGYVYQVWKPFMKYVHSSLPPCIHAPLQCDFAIPLRGWSLFPYPWTVAGLGTCFEPQNVAEVTSTLWPTEQAQVVCWLMARLSPSPQPTFCQPPEAEWPSWWQLTHKELPEPSLHCWLWKCEPQDGLQPSNGWLTHQRSACSAMCIYQLCCFLTKNVITYYYKRMKCEGENEENYFYEN